MTRKHGNSSRYISFQVSCEKGGRIKIRFTIFSNNWFNSSRFPTISPIKHETRYNKVILKKSIFVACSDKKPTSNLSLENMSNGTDGYQLDNVVINIAKYLRARIALVIVLSTSDCTDK